jgi:hypothetical protein
MFDDSPPLPFKGQPSAQCSETLVPGGSAIRILLTFPVTRRRAKWLAIPISHDLARVGRPAVEHKSIARAVGKMHVFAMAQFLSGRLLLMC